jgi:hypothetical protein
VKIDSVFGRFVDSWRLTTAEPVFANITDTLGYRFTLGAGRIASTTFEQPLRG